MYTKAAFIKHSLAIVFIISNLSLYSSDPIDLYFCTAANSTYFERVLNLIGCLHKVNFNEIGQIAVFDLGLTEKEKTKLKNIKKVAVYSVEKTNKDIITPLPTGQGKKLVLGYYSWKPVVIKQALDMFPYVLWLDAGTTILIDSLTHFTLW